MEKKRWCVWFEGGNAAGVVLANLQDIDENRCYGMGINGPVWPLAVDELGAWAVAAEWVEEERKKDQIPHA